MGKFVDDFLSAGGGFAISAVVTFDEAFEMLGRSKFPSRFKLMTEIGRILRTVMERLHDEGYFRSYAKVSNNKDIRETQVGYDFDGSFHGLV